MTTVAVFHAVGLQDLVAEVLVSSGMAASARPVDDGMTLVSSDVAPNRLAQEPYVKQCIEVWASLPRSTMNREIQQLLRAQLKTPPTSQRITGLRLRVHSDGQFASTPSNGPRLEKRLSSILRADVARRGGETEFWLVRRRDSDTVYFGQKYKEQNRRWRAKGALPGEFAAAMAHLLPLSHLSRVVDPFCGSGILGRAVLDRGADFAHLNDLDPGCPDPELLDGVPTSRYTVTHLDAGDLSPDQPCSALITDPPWGDFDSSLSGEDVLQKLFAASPRLLLPDARCVILVSAELAETPTVTRQSTFEWARTVRALVSGRPVYLLVGHRIG